MIEHVVFFKLKAMEKEEEEKLIKMVIGLKDKISFVKEISFNRTFTTERAKGYTHAIRVLFDTKKELEEYGPNKHHQEVAIMLKSLAEDSPICLDWERE